MRVRPVQQQLESVRLAGAYHSTVVQARLGEARSRQAQKKGGATDVHLQGGWDRRLGCHRIDLCCLKAEGWAVACHS
jgi:hypothetical protein